MVGYEMHAEAQRDLTAEQVRVHRRHHDIRWPSIPPCPTHSLTLYILPSIPHVFKAAKTLRALPEEHYSLASAVGGSS